MSVMKRNEAYAAIILAILVMLAILRPQGLVRKHTHFGLIDTRH